MLNDMKLQQGEKLKYDPYNIIVEKRKTYKLPSYENQFSLELHGLANQSSWEQLSKTLSKINQHIND